MISEMSYCHCITLGQVRCLLLAARLNGEQRSRGVGLAQLRHTRCGGSISIDENVQKQPFYQPTKRNGIEL